MSLIRTCDRCNEHYEQYGKWSVYNTEKEPNGVAFIHISEDTPADANDTKILKAFDLCPKCLDKLDKFIRGV